MARQSFRRYREMKTCSKIGAYRIIPHPEGEWAAWPDCERLLKLCQRLVDEDVRLPAWARQSLRAINFTPTYPDPPIKKLPTLEEMMGEVDEIIYAPICTCGFGMMDCAKHLAFPENILPGGAG